MTITAYAQNTLITGQETSQDSVAIGFESSRTADGSTASKVAGKVAGPRPAGSRSVDTGKPRPRECMVQVVIPSKKVQQSLDITVRDAANKFDIVPARLRKTSREVVVKDGGVVKYRIEPPVYRKVTERVEVRPEVRRTVVVPAVFEERTETVVVEAEHDVLERCRTPGVARGSGVTMMSLCTIHVPAKTKTIKRKVLVQPATTREEIEPAQYREITRMVLETPARAVPIEAEPLTKDIEVEEIAESERVAEHQLPPEVQKLTVTQFVDEPKVAVRRVLCEHEVTPDLVSRLQTALTQAGFSPGRADGLLGPSTMRSLFDYQMANNLAPGGLTLETLELLGLMQRAPEAPAQ